MCSGHILRSNSRNGYHTGGRIQISWVFLSCIQQAIPAGPCLFHELSIVIVREPLQLLRNIAFCTLWLVCQPWIRFLKVSCGRVKNLLLLLLLSGLQHCWLKLRLDILVKVVVRKVTTETIISGHLAIDNPKWETRIWPIASIKGIFCPTPAIGLLIVPVITKD